MNTQAIQTHKKTTLLGLFLALGTVFLSGCFVLGDEPLLAKKAVHNTHLLGKWEGDGMLLTIEKANAGKMQILLSSPGGEEGFHTVLEASTDSTGTSGFISRRHTDGMFGDALNNRYVHGYFHIEGEELSYSSLSDYYFKHAIKEGKLAGSFVNKDTIYLTGSAKKIRQILEKAQVDDFTGDTTYFKRVTE